ncbi:restriction endonuclease subunit S [Acetatifactor muris]|uniref:restriction endonuclease subunit S n=1 Tax=Acetatifactor muris TaxID=879566 RepID=UPI0023F2B5DA|nr:restriction endonuclease subunit S [Acetatifactor muris]
MKYNSYMLQEVCDFIDYRGKTPIKTKSGVPLVTAKIIKNGRIMKPQEFIAENKYDEWMRRGIPQKGDIVFTTEAPLGEVAEIKTDGKLAFAQRVIILEPRKEYLNNHYLLYALQDKGLKERIAARASGTTVTGIKAAELKKIFIDLPSIDIQKKVADILYSLDEKIALNIAINDNLEQQVRALFYAMFISSEDYLNWESGTFSDLIESTFGGDWGKESPTGNNTEMVYCIRGADIPDVKVGNKGKMPTRYILPKNFASKHLCPGDIVVEISGGSPTQSTGRVAAISQSFLDRYDKGMVCTNFCRAIKPKSGYGMFVYYYWQYLYDRNVFFSYENGTTGIKNLDLSGFIATEEIVIPPADLIQQFDDYCQCVFDQTFANGLENEQLSTLRDTLLPKLMSGELDVSSLDL